MATIEVAELERSHGAKLDSADYAHQFTAGEFSGAFRVQWRPVCGRYARGISSRNCLLFRGTKNNIQVPQHTSGPLDKDSGCKPS